MELDQSTLELVLTAQVLTLAAQLKDRAEKKGVRSTSDYVSEAVRELHQKRPEVLRLLRETH